MDDLCECGEPVYARGQCQRCYNRQYRDAHTEEFRRYRSRAYAKAKAAREAAEKPFERFLGLFCEARGCGWPTEPGRPLCPAHRSRLKHRGSVQARVPVMRKSEMTLPAPVQELVDEWIEQMRTDPHYFADVMERIVSDYRIQKNRVIAQGQRRDRADTYGDPT